MVLAVEDMGVKAVVGSDIAVQLAEQLRSQLHHIRRDLDQIKPGEGMCKGVARGLAGTEADLDRVPCLRIDEKRQMPLQSLQGLQHETGAGDIQAVDIDPLLDRHRRPALVHGHCALPPFAKCDQRVAGLGSRE